MLFRLVARITMKSKADATIVEYPLPAKAGGRMCKVASYQAKVIWASDAANAKVGVKLNHGPDGQVFTSHSTPIAPSVPGAVPGVVGGDADSTKVISEWLQPVATIQGPAGGPAQEATVEIYEMRNPFWLPPCPPGRGKIERFNRTAEADILRDLARDDVDPDCTALELRLAHYLTHDYNRKPHESLDRQTPEGRFLADDRPLRPYLDAEALRRKFFVREERVVSNDHVISFDSVFYEVPRGLAGQRVSIARDVFDARHLRLDHEGQSIRLHPVDLHANARARRGATTQAPEPVTTAVGAARRAAEKALAPITQPDGGFVADDPTEEPSWT